MNNTPDRLYYNQPSGFSEDTDFSRSSYFSNGPSWNRSLHSFSQQNQPYTSRIPCRDVPLFPNDRYYNLNSYPFNSMEFISDDPMQNYGCARDCRFSCSDLPSFSIHADHQQQQQQHPSPHPNGRINPSKSQVERMPSSSRNNKKNGFKKDVVNEINIEDVISNKNTQFTIMIRNIPNRYTKEAVLQLISTIINNSFNLVNFPIDGQTNRNLGYCFIRVADNPTLYTLYQNLHQHSWPNSNSVKLCYLCYSIDKISKRKK